MRVQIPAYTDHWMRGDRYGDVVSITSLHTHTGTIERATVKLDKSGKLARVSLDDCTIVETILWPAGQAEGD